MAKKGTVKAESAEKQTTESASVVSSGAQEKISAIREFVNSEVVDTATHRAFCGILDVLQDLSAKGGK